MFSHSVWAALSTAKSRTYLFICVFILFRESDGGAVSSSHKIYRPSRGITLNAFPNSTKARFPACFTLQITCKRSRGPEQIKRSRGLGQIRVKNFLAQNQVKNKKKWCSRPNAGPAVTAQFAHCLIRPCHTVP